MNKGYTLLELVVVMVIIGVLAMISIGSVGNSRNTAVKQQAIEMAISLKAMQTAARSHGVQVTVITIGNRQVPNNEVPRNPAHDVDSAPSGLWIEVDRKMENILRSTPGNPKYEFTASMNGNILNDKAIIDIGSKSFSIVGADFNVLNTMSFRMTTGNGSSPQDILANSPLFTGSFNDTLTFGTNGAASNNAAFAIIGAHRGIVYPNAPMAVVFVTTGGNIMVYYRPAGKNSTWQRI